MPNYLLAFGPTRASYTIKEDSNVTIMWLVSMAEPWIFDVESNEELEILLAKMPVYNFVKYTIHPLTEMKPP